MAEEIEAQTAEVLEAGPVRPLPARATRREMQPWQRDATTVALAAAGGAVAGVATVAALRSVRESRRRPSRRWPRRGREKVVASRSFLVDVHVLGR